MKLEDEVGSQSARNGLRERKKSATRQTLRNAALLLFTQKGFGGTSVDEIASTAAVSRSTFFRYFGSKEAVLFDEGDQRGAQLVALLSERPETESPAVAYARALIDMSLTFDADDGRDQARLVEDLFRKDEHLMLRRVNEVERWTEAVAQAFGRRRGRPTPNDEDQLAAAVCIATTQQISRRWTQPDSPGAEAVIRQIFDSLRTVCF